MANMDANWSKKLALFKKKVAKVFKRAGELTSLGGSQIGILIVNPEDRTQVIAWPSPEVALERFLRYQNTPEDNRVYVSSPVEAQLQPQETHAHDAINKDVELLMEKLANGRTPKELGVQDLAQLISFSSEMLKLVAAAIEEKTRNNQP